MQDDRSEPTESICYLKFKKAFKTIKCGKTSGYGDISPQVIKFMWKIGKDCLQEELGTHNASQKIGKLCMKSLARENVAIIDQCLC